MKLRVACNWDVQLLEGLAGLPVESVFGKLSEDIVGGGRPSAVSTPVSREEAQRYIAKVRAAGWGFNYLLNAACLGNMEYTASWRREFEELLDWVAAAGATEVTVAVPLLADIVRKRQPQLRIACSIFNRVASVRQAQQMEQMGFDSLVLDPMINRDLRLLGAIRKAVGCQLTLLANVHCLYQCPLRFYHANCLGHSSQQGHASGGQYQEYCYYQCTAQRFGDVGEFIRAPWIRPEDTGVYEAIGIDCFKVTERTASTEFILRVARAYGERRHEGDLLDLINFPEPLYRYILSATMPGEPLTGQLRPSIDNRKLDGFLEFFATCDCVNRSCDECGYCARVAGEVLTVSDAPKVATGFRRAVAGIVDGQGR